VYVFCCPIITEYIEGKA
jgi:hypothetical protein